ncbi:MAG TPA: hypothetical protein DCX07_05535 [Phycisphaerales bacterium]|nr:hypothetical protein [Phycisphaerales bacterium]
MLKLKIPFRLRLAALAAGELAVVLTSAALCSSPADAIYLAAVPAFAIYLLLFGRRIVHQLSWRHGAYFLLLTGLAAGYLIATARVVPLAKIRWSELGIAVYFLAAIHVIVWALDRGIHRGLSRLFRIRPGADRPLARVLPCTALRILLLAVLAGPVVAAAFTTHWVKFADLGDPASLAELPFEPAGFDAIDGVPIRGWYIPARDRFSDAAVILVPGRSMPKGCFLPYARMLRESGYNVLLIDLRGEGASGGHARGFGSIEARDVLGAVHYLKQAYPQASRHLFAFGVSHGGAAVLAAAGADPQIEGVVVDSLLPSPRRQVSEMTSWMPWPADRYFQQATLLLASAQLGCDLLDAGPARDIAAIAPRPVLLIHGLADRTAPVRHAEEIYSAGGRPVMLWKVPNAGHAESLLADQRNYAEIVTQMFDSIRLGLPAFDWAHPRG